MDHDAPRGRPDLIEKSIPNYPAMGKRILQDNGSWLRTLTKPNVELVRTGHRAHRPRGCGHRRRRAPRGRRHLLRDRVPPQRVPRDDRAHRAQRRVAARAVGRRADRAPRDHDPELPEPLLHVRPGHEPRARCEPVLPLGVPDPLRDGLHPPGPGVGRPRPSRCARTRTTSTSSATSRDRPARLVTPVDRAQPLQEPAGQDLHAVALAARALLGVDARPTPRSTSSADRVEGSAFGEGWLSS